MNELIFDRTQADVNYAINHPSSATFLKGAYNYTDLNRIETWCEYLAEKLTSYNYFVKINAKTDWTMSDFPTSQELERIRKNVNDLKQAYFSFTQIPENLEYMTIKKANDIEKILDEIDKIILAMENNFVYSGVAGSGQNRVWQQRFRKPKTWNSQPYKLSQYLSTDTLKMIATDNNESVGIEEKIICKNEILNGGFKTLDGWIANKTTALGSIEDEKLKITGNPTETTYIWYNTTKKIRLRLGHKYYCSVDCLKSGGGTTAWAMYNTTNNTSYWSKGIVKATDNLLRYPKTFEGWSFASNMSGNDGVITWDAVSTLGWNATTNRDVPIKYKDVRDKEIKISFDVRCDEYEALNQQTGNGLILNLALFHTGAGSRYKYQDQLYFEYKMSNEWQRIEYTFVANDGFFKSGSGEIDVENDNFVIGLYNYSLYKMQLRDLKIEYTDKSDVKQSAYYTATNNAETDFLLYGTTYEWASDFEVKWDNLLVMDLTEAFGTGNEPTEEWCDANIPYFDGEYILKIPQKAILVQLDKRDDVYASIQAINNSMQAIDDLVGYECEFYTLTNLLKPIEEEEFYVGVKSNLHTKYGDSSLMINGLEGDNEEYASAKTTYKLEPTHIYYACVEVYSETGVGTIDFFYPNASPSFFGVKGLNANTWTKWSIVSGRSSFTAGEYPYRLDYNNGGVVDKAWFDGVMIIDLTEAFGSGNEPTQDWCDKNIPYFSGIKTIKIRKENP